MKKIRDNKIPLNDDMSPEYSFDYKQAKSNRFAEKLYRDIELVTLDPDVANVFRDAETVNAVLRALIATMPQPSRTKQIPNQK
jgi:hypothetical protein